ncbi:MucR family transcriptional regulator [Aquibaculum arenosum]|uniref:MucR family transcriptional regulator n=1 Tax=Aquibaculum arenosum TaxID=3032591 RepID=A0ABT5YQE3_9PROT|nr:MucR family transcriptional regulator [Fodinicurvata sp. CAU 1616]MDF2097202.1 MucR family transcriptional regulator [Fodinicurvata sp. CAU 1616]
MEDKSTDEAPKQSEILTHTAQIVAAHVGHNAIAPNDVPTLIKSVHDALTSVGTPEPEEPQQEPAVPIRRSIQPDYLVCLEDGKKLKMLRRHLKTAFNMTPEEYRAKWNLSPNYPMVAPNYAKQRSDLAKQFRLGKRKEEEPATPAPKTRGRKKKSES